MIDESTLSILIPTRNRSHFLIRLLQYYEAIQWRIPLIIGDASDAEDFDMTAQEVDRLKGVLHIKHVRQDSAVGVLESCADLCRNAPTPHVMITGDDDFVIRRPAIRCAQFLEENKDYRMAQGTIFRLGVHLQENGSMAPRRLMVGPARPITSEKPEKRLIDLMVPSWALNSFAVRRRLEMRDDLLDTVRHVSGRGSVSSSLSEIGFNGLSILRGKQKSFPEPFLVMLTHEWRGGLTAPTHRHLFDRSLLAAWPEPVKGLRDLWVNDLKRIPQMTDEKARDIAEAAFMSYPIWKYEERRARTLSNYQLAGRFWYAVSRLTTKLHIRLMYGWHWNMFWFLNKRKLTLARLITGKSSLGSSVKVICDILAMPGWAAGITAKIRNLVAND